MMLGKPWEFIPVLSLICYRVCTSELFCVSFPHWKNNSSVYSYDVWVLLELQKAVNLSERKELPWNGICLYVVLLQVSYWTALPHNFLYYLFTFLQTDLHTSILHLRNEMEEMKKKGFKQPVFYSRHQHGFSLLSFSFLWAVHPVDAVHMTEKNSGLDSAPLMLSH